MKQIIWASLITLSLGRMPWVDSAQPAGGGWARWAKGALAPSSTSIPKSITQKKESNLIISTWDERSGLIEDPTDPEYYIVYRFARSSDPNGSILRYEQEQFEKISKMNELGNRPHLLQGVHRFKGKFQGSPSREISSERHVLVYRIKKEVFKRIDSKLSGSPLERYSLIKKAAIRNLKDYLALFKKGIIHTSLTPLTHFIPGGRTWIWNYHPVGGIEEFSKIVKESNFTWLGLKDYEHLRDNVFEYSPYWLGQALCEWSLVVSYMGMINELDKNLIADILLTGYKEVFASLEITDKFPSIERSLRGFLFWFEKELALNSDEISSWADGRNPTLNRLVVAVKVVIKKTLKSRYCKRSWKYISFGSFGTEPGELCFPMAIAIDRENHIFVVNTDGRIQKFKKDGQLIKEFRIKVDMPASSKPLTSIIEDELEKIGAIVTDKKGNIFIADAGKQRILKFNPDGELVLKFGGKGILPGKFLIPISLDIDQEDNIIVADSGQNSVQIFDKDGNFVRRFGKGGDEPGRFHSPRSVGFDKQGHIVVADTGNHRIQIFDAQGQFIRQFGQRGSQPCELNQPESIAINHKGHILVADTKNYRVQEFDSMGNFVRAFGSYGRQPGQFEYPLMRSQALSIAVDHKDNIVIANRDINRIDMFINDDVVKKATPEIDTTIEMNL